MNGATRLIMLGCIVGALVLVRSLAFRRADLDNVPDSILRRIEVGSRVAPWVGGASAAAVLVGLALLVWPD